MTKLGGQVLCHGGCCTDKSHVLPGCKDEGTATRCYRGTSGSLWLLRTCPSVVMPLKVQQPCVLHRHDVHKELVGHGLALSPPWQLPGESESVLAQLDLESDALKKFSPSSRRLAHELLPLPTLSMRTHRNLAVLTLACEALDRHGWQCRYLRLCRLMKVVPMTTACPLQRCPPLCKVYAGKLECKVVLLVTPLIGSSVRQQAGSPLCLKRL